MSVSRLSLLLLQAALLLGSRAAVRSGDVSAEEALQPRPLRAAPAAPPGDTEPQRRLLKRGLPRPVSAFLLTGDPSSLKPANCSRRFELSFLRGIGSQPPAAAAVSRAVDALLRAANFLNLVLQNNRSREPNPGRDLDWYRALLRSLLEADSRIHRAVLSFSPLLLQASRTGAQILLQDLVQKNQNHSAETDWYHGVKDRKKKKSPDRSQVPDRTHIRWSAPYLDCEDGNFVPRWILTLTAGFYGLKPNDPAPEFRGVLRVDVDLQDVDIDQCSSNGWFAGTHQCNLSSMECSPQLGHGFVLDKYKCQCRRGFYHPSRISVHPSTRFSRTGKKWDAGPNADEGSSSDCLPCQSGCSYCKDSTPCVVGGAGGLRLAVLSVQSLCALLLFISMVIVYRHRRNKSIRASGLILLETILSGALLLYFPVWILYFQPSVFRCILLRWVRLLGFATVYGTVTLKLYRVLKVFLSRTAQRIPYMTSWRVLRLLTFILLIVCWFLVGWTWAVCQNPDRKWALIDVGYTPDGLQFSMCLLDRWDYMMAVAEFLFLLWAVYLCYAVRTVPSAFHEPRYMAIAVHNELVLSAIFYVIRFSLAPELHPDWMLLLFFSHTQLTVTVTLALLLLPKFLFTGTHLRDDLASEAYEDELDMGRSGSYLNSSITSAWSEHSLDPEDIREELKKLYSQLEIYKRKKMLANNPHLQKKRSSKKGLGRSLMRRITELPESVHRQCSRDEKEVGEHGSNRNSICTLKKNPFDPPHTKAPKEETLRNKVFSLKKSHSSYDHVRDQNQDSNSCATDTTEVAPSEGSLLETLMGRTLVKKKSAENLGAPSESTESVPLVCKSASAHNLTADKKAIQPRASMLQKSISVIASAKEKTLGLSQSKIKDSQSSTEPETGGSSNSTESKASLAKGRVMKPVSGTDPTTTTVQGKDVYDLYEVCPWEVEDLPTPSENKVQKHVSIAPEETTTVHGGSTKGGKPSKQKLTDSSTPSSRSSKDGQKTTAVRAEVCPWEEGGGTHPGQGETSKQQVPSKTSRFPVPQQPSPAVESSKTNRADICPWDFEGSQKNLDSQTSEETRQKKGSSPVEVQRKGTTPSEPSKTAASLQLTDVCPWDYDGTSPTTERTPSPSQGSKTKEDPTRKKCVPSTRTLEKPKDSDNGKSRTKAKDKSKTSEKQNLAEVCPWDVEGHQQGELVEKRKSANVGAAKVKPAEVCPWDFEDASVQKGSPVEKPSNPNIKGGTVASKTPEVCPWDFDDNTPSKNIKGPMKQ